MATTASVDFGAAYRTAFIDWLACACAGAGERAARSVRASGSDLLADVAFAATAGHVLDFDDTYSPGIAHVSAPTAPAALVLAADLGLSLRRALDAYADGYEAMAALAAASHPALYDAGWHPTTVCGPIGAVLAASRLLELSEAQQHNAVAIALLRAGGTRGAFGSDGKAIQVGLAAAAGVQAALMGRAGASVDARSIHGPLGFAGVTGARWPQSDEERTPSGPGARAIDSTWIKLHPSCLGTHAPIEAAAELRAHGHALDHRLWVIVHPVARQAAHLETISDGLSAKFSIPYCVAFTLIHGPPRYRDFASVDAASRDASRHVSVVVDRSLPEFGAVIAADGRELARVSCPPGAPERPVGSDQLIAKVVDLGGDQLLEVLRDLEAPASAALRAAGLARADADAGSAGARSHATR